MISSAAQFGGDLAKMKMGCLWTTASDSDTASTSCDASDCGRHEDADDEVLSVGCESPPPVAGSITLPQSRSLNFSIDNILRPEFGGPRPRDRPVDLSKAPAPPTDSKQQMLWPAWVYCTRYSDRPSSGRSPRTKRLKKKDKRPEEKRPRTAFSGEQLARLKSEFAENRYLTEKRRQQLAVELGLNEAQIKIWFQNKRAKIKKATGVKNPLALSLMAQGLYNHSTVPLSKEEEEQLAAQEPDE